MQKKSIIIITHSEIATAAPPVCCHLVPPGPEPAPAAVVVVVAESGPVMVGPVAALWPWTVCWPAQLAGGVLGQPLLLLEAELGWRREEKLRRSASLTSSW